MPPLYGPQVRRSSQLDAIAQALLNTDAREVRSPVEGVAKALTMGLGGYFAGQSEKQDKARQQATADTYARALKAGEGWKNPDTGEMMIKPDRQAMASILAGNPDTAPMAMSLGLGELDYQRGRQDKLADVADERNYRTSERVAGQDFQSGENAANRLQQATSMEVQQRFTAAENALGRAQQVAMQDRSIGAQQALQQAQQAFTAAQNDLNREAQGPARNLDLQLKAAQVAEHKQKLEDADKSKTEAVVSTDRMIRSIDELDKHPGLTGAVGFGYGKALGLIPGTDESSFDVRLETLKSQAFLPMVAQLKGMGQLSDAEGKKLTAAIGALDTRMSEKEFKASLAEIKGDLMAARQRMGAPSQSTVSGGQSTGGGGSGGWGIQKVQ